MSNNTKHTDAASGDDLETVADAIDAARYQHPTEPRERPRPFSEADSHDREYATRLARAAIAALGKPTGQPQQGREIDDDTILRLLYVNGLGQKADRLIYTKWKDSIDIDLPTLQLKNFVKAICAEHTQVSRDLNPAPAQEAFNAVDRYLSSQETSPGTFKELWETLRTALPAPQAGCAKEGRPSEKRLADIIKDFTVCTSQEPTSNRCLRETCYCEAAARAISTLLANAASPPQPVAEREWQQIEAAPKDGASIDLWIRDRSSGATQRYLDAVWAGGWCSISSHTCLGEYPFANYEALFWMPLPAPPLLAEQGTETK